VGTAKPLECTGSSCSPFRGRRRNREPVSPSRSDRVFSCGCDDEDIDGQKTEIPHPGHDGQDKLVSRLVEALVGTGVVGVYRQVKNTQR